MTADPNVYAFTINQQLSKLFVISGAKIEGRP